MIKKELVLKNDEGKEFEVEVYLNLASIRAIEKELKAIDKNYNFYKCLPLIDMGELTVTITYIANVVHLAGKKNPVGVDWFDNNKINFFEYSQELTLGLIECLNDNKPTAESKKK